MLTRKALGGHLGLETTAIGDLFRRGVVSPEMTLAQARLAYLAHLREQAAGRRGEAVDGQAFDLVSERARLAAAQADGQLHRNALATRETITRDEAKQHWGALVLNVKERMRTLPVSAMTRIPNFSKEQARVLATMIDEGLGELAGGAIPSRTMHKQRHRMRVTNDEATPPEAA